MTPERREVLTVFDAARRYSRALETRERKDRKDGMAFFIILAVVTFALVCAFVAVAQGGRSDTQRDQTTSSAGRDVPATGNGQVAIAARVILRKL